MSDMAKRRISIIIVHFQTKNRKELLVRCIEGIKRQTCKDFELILVCDNMKEVPISLLSKITELDYKINKSSVRRGAAWCRKIGIQISIGKFVAFLDDDAIPACDWIEKILEKMEKSAFVGVGGKTLSAKPKTIIQVFADLDNSQRIPLKDENNNIYNISTVNACFRRDALIETNTIHNNYIHFAKRGIFFWFEDYDITYRLINVYGATRLGVSESAVVYHRHRSTLRESFRQFIGYGKGAYFWIWNYKKRSNDLKGGQSLPPRVGSLLCHVYKLITALPKYKNHYLRSKRSGNGIFPSIYYALFGWLMRVAFHFGAFRGLKLLKELE